jgi:hypothetical protein
VGLPGGDAYGGAIYVASGTATLTNVILSDNRAIGGHGGGGGQIGFHHTRGSGGSGGNGGNGYGGAMYVAAGTVKLTNVTFSSNLAAGGAGGTASTVKLAGPGGNGYGGGLYVAGGSVTLIDDTVSGNSALAGAGKKGPGAGQGEGGGLYIASAASVYLDAFTLNHTKQNTPDNIYGSYTLIS